MYGNTTVRQARTTRCSIVWGVSVVLLAASPVTAQRATSPSPARVEAVRRTSQATLDELFAPLGISVPKASSTPAAKASELRIVWEPLPTVSGRSTLARPRMVSRVRSDNPFPRLRVLELAEGMLVVVSLSRDGVLAGWSTSPDPRVVRLEIPGVDGVLTGQVVKVPRPEFLALVPDDPSVVEVRVLEPVRSVSGLVLNQVAVFVF
jgi:hypothetical protein